MVSNDHGSVPAADERAQRSDPRDWLIALALADRVLPPVPGDEIEAAECLTPEDREALASLGSSEDLIDGLLQSMPSDDSAMAESAGEDLEQQTADATMNRLAGSGASGGQTAEKSESDDQTRLTDYDPTVPAPGSAFWRGGDSPDLDQLKERLRAVQQAKQINWTSTYRKREELGRGGQGVVYLALDGLDGELALKIYSPLPYGNATAYREAMRRMHAVASVVRRIDQDNLVRVQRFVDYQGIYMMVMQWIDGYDLRRLLDPQLSNQLRQLVDDDRWAYLDDVIYAKPAGERLCLRPLVAVNIIEKCLRGLGALHEKGIVHGDIKPSNIMLDCNGSIRLIDIGSACSNGSPPRHRVWTPRYAPPEFLERGEWTPKSDLASLGYVLIELLSGRADFAGPRIGDESTTTFDRHRDEVLLEAKRTLPQRLPELLADDGRKCDRLMRLCQKLIDPDPQKRFANTSEAIDEDNDGTWHFRMELVRGYLAVHEVSAIKYWVDDVKKVAPSLEGRQPSR